MLVCDPRKHVKQFVNSTAVLKYVATRLRPLDIALLNAINPHCVITCLNACSTDIQTDDRATLNLYSSRGKACQPPRC
jgi:hypothetical protein